MGLWHKVPWLHPVWTLSWPGAIDRIDLRLPVFLSLLMAARVLLYLVPFAMIL